MLLCTIVPRLIARPDRLMGVRGGLAHMSVVIVQQQGQRG